MKEAHHTIWRRAGHHAISASRSLGGWVQKLLRENLESIDPFLIPSGWVQTRSSKDLDPTGSRGLGTDAFFKYMTHKTFMTFVGHFGRSLRLYPTYRDCPVIHGFHFCKTPYLCPTGKDPWIQFSKIQAPVPNRALPGNKNTFFAKYLLTNQQAVCYSPTR